MDVFQKLKDRLSEVSEEAKSSEVSESSRVKELEQEVDKLRHVVNANYEVYLRKLEKRKERIKDLEQGLKDAQQDNQRLEKEGQECQQRLRACRDSVDELEGFRTQETAKLKHMLLSAETQLQEERRRSSQLQLRIDKDKEAPDNQSLRESRQIVHDEVYETDADQQVEDAWKTADLSSELAECRESLQSALSERDALKNSLLDMELKFHEQQELLNAERHENKLEMSRLKTQMETMQVTLGHREGEIKSRTTDFRNDVARLEQQHNEALELNSSQTSRITCLEAELSMLRQQLNEANDSHRVLAAVHDELRHHNDTLLVKGKEIESDYSKLKADYDELVKEQGKSSEAILSLESKLGAVEAEKDHLDDQKQSLESSIEKTNKELQNEIEQNRMLSLDLEKLHEVIKDLEDSFESRMEASQLVRTLRESKQNLEDELNDCKKLNKVHQQRLEDVKKTLQKELREVASNSNVAEVGSVSPVSFTSNFEGREEEEKEKMSEVNFKYLKHVIMKFLTSKEYEAKNLTRAIGELLKLSREEERLLSEHLEWKSSWFGIKPNLGKGQYALSIDHQ